MNERKYRRNTRLMQLVTIIILVVLWFKVIQPAYSAELYTFGALSYDYTKSGIFYDDDKEWFETVLGSGVSQDIIGIQLFAEAEIKTEMFLSDIGSESGLSFMPTLNSYFVRAGFSKGPFTIGYEHLCNHNSDNDDYRRKGGHNRVYVSYDSRNAK